MESPCSHPLLTEICNYTYYSEHHREDNNTNGKGCDIPSSLEYKIFYQNVLDEPSPAIAIHQVIGASVR